MPPFVWARSAGPRLDARGPGAAVDGGVLTEDLAGTQITKVHFLAGNAVNGDVGSTLGDEEYVLRGIEIINNRLSWLEAPPRTALLNSFQRVRWDGTSLNNAIFFRDRSTGVV